MNILIADDEPLELEQMIYLLKPHFPNWTFHTAQDASQALQLAKKHRMTIAFLDIQMPGKDGITLSKELKELYEVDIIMVTAYQTFEYAQQALRIGVKDYLTKPVIASELNAIVEKYKVWSSNHDAIQSALSSLLNKSDYTQHQHTQSFLLFTIQQKLSGMNLKVIRLFYLLTGIELWLIQLISISVLSEIMLNIPVPITLFLFLIIMLLLDRIMSVKSILWLEILFIIALFSLLIFIPIYYFVQNGASTVYEGIRLYHPYLFYFKNSEILLFFVIIQLAVLGQVLFDKSTWYLIAFIKPKKVRRSLLSSGVILALLTLSFTAILMIALYGGSFGQFQVLIFTFLYEVQPGFLTFAFLVIVLLAVVTTLLVDMRATKRFFVKKRPYYFYLICLMVIILIFFLSIDLTILGVIYSFAFLHISMLPFMLILLFTNRSIHQHSWLVLLLSMIIGLGVGLNFNMLYGLAASFMISCIYQLMLQTETKEKKPEH